MSFGRKIFMVHVNSLPPSVILKRERQLILLPLRWSHYISPKHLCPCTRLHAAMSNITGMLILMCLIARILVTYF